MRAVGEEVASRLKTGGGEAVFLIPTGGYDCYATKGEALYDPAADAAFVAALKETRP